MLCEIAACSIAVVTVSFATILLPDSASAAPRANYPVGNAATGYEAEITSPTSSPPGVDDWSCKPSVSHPDPVVLLPGTLYDIAESWQALGPILANDGYCVYGLNYGPSFATTLSDQRVWAAGPIEQSAEQLSSFVARVLRATGAAQVDIVGWSQGGMMPRWYMRFDGGAKFVHELVGLAPSNHGTTFNGLFHLIDAETAAGLPGPLSLVGCEACTQQLEGSEFLDQLDSVGDTLTGVRYVVIETDHDEVVTPYSSAFLAGPQVDNVLLQSQCPGDEVDHLGIVYDTAALQDVVNALGPDIPAFRPKCGLSLPLVGTP